MLDYLGGVSSNDAIIRERAMHDASGAYNYVIPYSSSFQYDAVHADKAVVTDKNRCSPSIFLIEIQSSLFGVERMKIIVNDLAVGSDSGVLSDFDVFSRVNSRTRNSESISNLNLSAISCHDNGTLP